MKKLFFIIFALLITQGVWAQKYYTKTGLTEFKASVAAFEPIEAKNHSTTAVLNIASGQVASLLFVKAFHFKVALMEEHFNENYMDADRFPKATFKGKLVGFRLTEVSTKTKEYKLKGILTIRGESKAVTTTAQVQRRNGRIIVTTDFEVSPGNFGIEIPGIVRKKISKTIKIHTYYELIKRG